MAHPAPEESKQSDQHLLPHMFPEGEYDGIPRISQETMLDVVQGQYHAHFARTLIIDCRFEYEFRGGHIRGAIHGCRKQLVGDLLFERPTEEPTLLVIHCEFSLCRAPALARDIRARDRTANSSRYPRLTYPHLYVLQGGYKAFFDRFPAACDPSRYVPMDAAEHHATRDWELSLLRRRGGGGHVPRTRPNTTCRLARPPPVAQQDHQYPSIIRPCSASILSRARARRIEARAQTLVRQRSPCNGRRRVAKDSVV